MSSRAMLVYASVTFLSAFLLFLVQPLLGKILLPWFGGAPAVWSTCLVFFQAALLLGYAAAHLTTRLAPRRQAILYLALLAVSLVQLPLTPPEAWKPTGTEWPTSRIFVLLTLTVGLPYLLMASTAPLVQRWASRDPTIDSPYRLYAVSNAGSLAGLLSYPFLIERVLAVGAQRWLWSSVYAAFALAAAWLAWTRGRSSVGAIGSSDTELAAGAPVAGPSSRVRLWWFALPAAASGLLVAATNDITLNIAVIPFLWVAPLALYLVTFMLAFGNAYSRRGARVLLVASLLLVALTNLFYVSALWQISVGLLVLFAGALACHGELARLAPHPRHLTAYYLAIAGGGVAGGTLVALVAPVVFREFWEFPLFLILTYTLFVSALRSSGASRRRGPLRWMAVAAVPCLVFASYAWTLLLRSGETVVTARNFFGVLRVYDTASSDVPALRRLQHGGIVHGMQFLDPARRTEPTAYYRVPSGVAAAIQQHPRRLAGEPLHVGVIGLGVGTIAAWGLPGDRIRFYEINPQVIDVARRYFTFLSDAMADVEIVTGDARLSLERELADDTVPPFDIFVVDAFSGDAIPAHLLTREGVELYWRALPEDGVLVFNVTNRYLDLAPVVRGVAAAFDRQVVQVVAPSNPQNSALASDWMIVTSNQALLAALTGPDRPPGARIPRGPALLWTDRFSNLFDVLR